MTVHQFPDKLDVRHNTRPDYSLTVYITGVRLSEDNVEWKISRLDDEHLSREEVVYILENLAQIIIKAKHDKSVCPT